MLGEAKKARLFVDSTRLKTVLQKTRPSSRPWAERQHESLTPSWWLAEFFPKLQSRPGSSLKLPQIGLGRHRYVQENALMHKSTLLRIRETGYAPPNLTKDFMQRVRDIPAVP